MLSPPITQGVRLLIALLALAVMAWAYWLAPPPLVHMENVLRDGMTRLSARQSTEDRIVIVDIDEVSLRSLGSWPWTRSRLADLVETLLQKGEVRLVGLDMVFPEPGNPSGDQRLSALAREGLLVLAQILDYVERDAPLAEGILGASRPKSGTEDVIEASGYIANHTGFKEAKCVGNVGYRPDSDGVLRFTHPRTSFQGSLYPLFSEELLRCSGLSVPAVERIDIKSLRIPYARHWSSYVVISAKDVLDEKMPLELIKGRIAIVGSSALGLGDRVATPLASLNAGVMVHASMLSGLLDGQPRFSMDRTQISVVVWTVWTSMLVLYLAFSARLRPWQSVSALLGGMASWIAAAWVGSQMQLDLAMIPLLLASLVLLMLAVPFEWWLSQQKSARLLSTLSHYVAPPVLEELVKRDLIHSLAPAHQQITVLIADMEGYTRNTNQLSLDAAARLTKDFLECLTRPVLENGGTLDKYSGDGLVAFWGAPVPVIDHADRAVDTAIAILQEIRHLNRLRAAAALPPVYVRIGIESGAALVGDLGTTFRSTYTAVGDCINFASRLETAAKDFPSRLLIGETANRLLQRNKTQALGNIVIRDTQKEMPVFTVLQSDS